MPVKSIENIVAEELNKNLSSIIQQITDKLTEALKAQETLKEPECINVYVDGVRLFFIHTAPRVLKKDVYLTSQSYVDINLIELLNDAVDAESNKKVYLYIESDPKTKIKKIILFCKLVKFMHNPTSWAASLNVKMELNMHEIRAIMTGAVLVYSNVDTTKLLEELDSMDIGAPRDSPVINASSRLNNLFREFGLIRRDMIYLGTNDISTLNNFQLSHDHIATAYKNLKEELLKLVPDLNNMFNKYGELIFETE
jgi:hypothetical protein